MENEAEDSPWAESPHWDQVRHAINLLAVALSEQVRDHRDKVAEVAWPLLSQLVEAVLPSLHSAVLAEVVWEPLAEPLAPAQGLLVVFAKPIVACSGYKPDKQLGHASPSEPLCSEYKTSYTSCELLSKPH